MNICEDIHFLEYTNIVGNKARRCSTVDLESIAYTLKECIIATMRYDIGKVNIQDLNKEASNMDKSKQDIIKDRLGLYKGDYINICIGSIDRIVDSNEHLRRILNLFNVIEVSATEEELRKFKARVALMGGIDGIDIDKLVVEEE